LRPARALQLAQVIRFEQLPDYLARLRNREVTGRIVAQLA
jgi:hypothetical protein